MGPVVERARGQTAGLIHHCLGAGPCPCAAVSVGAAITSAGTRWFLEMNFRKKNANFCFFQVISLNRSYGSTVPFLASAVPSLGLVRGVIFSNSQDLPQRQNL